MAVIEKGSDHLFIRATQSWPEAIEGLDRRA